MPRRLRLKPPGDYPIDELPLRVQKSIRYVVAATQTSPSYVGPTVLSAMSSAVQDGCNVRVNGNIHYPLSTYTIFGAPPGSGKTITLNKIYVAMRARDDALQTEIAEQQHEYAKDLRLWNTKDKAAEKLFSNAFKNREDTEEHEQLSRLLLDEKPTPPLSRKLILNDITTASLKHELGSGNACFTIASDEAGFLFRSLLKETTDLNNLWSGGSIAMKRLNQPKVYVNGARVAALLMLQDKILLKNIQSDDGKVNRDNGFWSRCLMVIGESTQGQRIQVDTENLNHDDIDWFHNRMTTMLQLGIERRKSNDGFHTVELSPDALAFWNEMYAAIEFNMLPGEVLESYLDAASRLLEHATRLAAIIEVFTRGHVEQVSLASMEAGYAIANWHTDHFIQIMSDETETNDASKAEKLHAWLKTNVLFKGHIEIDKNYIRIFGPACIRSKVWLDDALEILVSQGLVRVYKSSNKIKVSYIPAEYVHSYRESNKSKLLLGATSHPFATWQGPLPFDLRDIEKVPKYRPWSSPL